MSSSDEDKYNDPVKQLSRRQIYSFCKKHLPNIPHSDLKGFYLPGSMNYEWWILKKLGFHPENCMGVEDDGLRYRVLEDHANGINIDQISFEDYVQQQACSSSPQRFHYISLDTEGQLTDSFLDTLRTIFHNDLLHIPGVLVTNVYGKREKEHVKTRYAEWQVLKSVMSSAEIRADGELNRVVFSQNPPEIEDPLEHRSDGISGAILSIVIPYTSSYDRGTLMRKIQFMRKYFGSRSLEKLMQKTAKAVKKGVLETEREYLEKYLKGKITLEEALTSAKTPNLSLNFQKSLIEFLYHISSFNEDLILAIFTTFFDPILLTDHKRFSYVSNTRGNMYLDLFAFDRASTSHVAGYMDRFRELLHWTGSHFILTKKVAVGTVKKEKKKSMREILQLGEYFRKHLTDLSIYPSLDDRVELKLSGDFKDNNHQLEKPQKSEVVVTGYKPPITQHDLVPSGFFYRLHETYQARINDFVDQANEKGISAERVSPIMDSKWFRKPTIPGNNFSCFWDKLYEELASDSKITKDRVSQIWQEAATGKIQPSTASTLEQRLTTATPKETVANFQVVDSKHPDYVREKREIIQLLDQGHSTQEIRSLKPNVKPQAISGIAAWYRHRDSWN